MEKILQLLQNPFTAAFLRVFLEAQVRPYLSKIVLPLPAFFCTQTSPLPCRNFCRSQRSPPGLSLPYGNPIPAPPGLSLPGCKILPSLIWGGRVDARVSRGLIQKVWEMQNVAEGNAKALRSWGRCSSTEQGKASQRGLLWALKLPTRSGLAVSTQKLFAKK